MAYMENHGKAVLQNRPLCNGCLDRSSESRIDMLLV